MFSKESLYYFINLIKFGSSLGFLPYKWNSNIQQLETVSTNKLYYWYFTVSACTIMIFAKIHIVLREVFYLAKIGPLLFQFLVICVYIIGLIVHLNTVLFMDDVKVFTNQILKLNRRLLVSEMFYKAQVKDGLEKYIKFYSFITIAAIILYFPFQYFEQMELQNLYLTYFSHWTGKNFLLRVAYQLFECLLASHYFTVAVFYNFLLVGVINSAKFWFTYLTTPTVSKNLCRPRILKRRIIIYKGFQMIMNTYISACAQLLIPAGYFFISTMLILCGFVEIKFYKVLAPHDFVCIASIGLMGLVLIFVCFTFSAYVIDKSIEFKILLERNYKTRRHIERSIARSLRTLQFPVGSFFIVQKTTFLTFYHVSTDCLKTLLLAF